MAHVLVVDNDEAIRETLRFALEDEQYVVLDAPDGELALAILRTYGEPLVVLLDFVMPRLNGLGVLQAVRADANLATRHAFILITASLPHSIPAAVTDVLTELAVPVVWKPFDIHELLALVGQTAQRLPALQP